MELTQYIVVRKYFIPSDSFLLS